VYLCEWCFGGGARTRVSLRCDVHACPSPVSLPPLPSQTGECLQLDSGQGGCCSQAWDVWTNNAASGLCNDPASCCGSKQQLWNYDPVGRTLKTNTTGQCLSVHAGGLHNVGVAPCTPLLGGLQVWRNALLTSPRVHSPSHPSTHAYYHVLYVLSVHGTVVKFAIPSCAPVCFSTDVGLGLCHRPVRLLRGPSRRWEHQVLPRED
jgi:hypothetical protein